LASIRAASAPVSPGGFSLGTRISAAQSSIAESKEARTAASKRCRSWVAIRSQSKPSVATRSPVETVESVVARTNTPGSGASTVSTVSP